MDLLFKKCLVYSWMINSYISMWGVKKSNPRSCIKHYPSEKKLLQGNKTFHPDAINFKSLVLLWSYKKHSITLQVQTCSEISSIKHNDFIQLTNWREQNQFRFENTVKAVVLPMNLLSEEAHVVRNKNYNQLRLQNIDIETGQSQIISFFLSFCYPPKSCFLSSLDGYALEEVLLPNC